MTAARVKAGPGKQRRSLASDRRGAVYVEFLAVFLPILFVFLGLAQTAGMYSAKLITEHSAVVGARAAAVVLADDPKEYGNAVGQYSGKRQEKIEKAVAMVLLANGSIIDYEVQVLGANGQAKTSFDQQGGYQMATVKVRSTYLCRLSTVTAIVCGSFSGMAVLEAQASMPVHMAPYTYPN